MKVGKQQQEVADQMSALGFAWIRQTVGQIERGARDLKAAELLGLALVLDVHIWELLDLSRYGVPFRGVERMLPLVVRAWLRGSLRVGLEWDESLQPRSFRYVPEDRIGAEALGWEIRPAGSLQRSIEDLGFDAPKDLMGLLQKATKSPQEHKKAKGNRTKRKGGRSEQN